MDEPISILKLKGVIRHYDWGGRRFIPDLVGETNTANLPCAELWIGAHPAAPSLAICGEQETPLNELLARRPELMGAAQPRFGAVLPFLMKVLDAREMLSIQAHPSKQQAEAGFAREEAQGIERNAPNRNYKDDNHKPEVHVALTEFWMLHGFRAPAEIAALLDATPEFASLRDAFAADLKSARGPDASREVLRPDDSKSAAVAPDMGPDASREVLRRLYGYVMNLPKAEIDAVLNPLLARIAASPAPPKDSPDYWAQRAAQVFPLPDGHRDRGIVSIYLLNLVRLEPGQGTYQAAGCLHAYLEGVNIELMANSDNVLRGGLTPKHVDVPELLSALTFESGRPQILTGDLADAGQILTGHLADTGQILTGDRADAGQILTGDRAGAGQILTGDPAGAGQILTGDPVDAVETRYPTPADEFELSRVELAPHAEHACTAQSGPQTLLVTEGDLWARSAATELSGGRGALFFVPGGLDYSLRPGESGAVIFKSTLPGSS